MRHGRVVTAGDVAAAAGVSLATVDRVLNGRSGVRHATVASVQAAVDRLGFRKDVAAATLARRRRYRFHFLLPNLPRNSFMQGVRREVEAAILRGLDQRMALSVATYAPFDAADLATRLRGCVGGDIMGVAFVAVDAPEVHDAIDALVDAGVAVVTVVSDAAPSRRAEFIGPDNTAAGRVAGTLLGRFLGERAGPVLTVAGRLTLRDHAERHLGFSSVIAANFPRFELLPVIESLDDGAVTEALVAAALHQRPDIVGLYNMGAGTRGIVAALESAGRRDVVAIGHELTPGMRDALLGGSFDAAIDQNASDEVRRAVRTLKAIADGEVDYRPPPVRIDIFLKDNLP